MKYLTSLILAFAVAQAALIKRSNPLGIDVSNYQPNVNWNQVKSNGIQFAYIKATEGTSDTSSTFNSQYDDAAKAGLIRGAYHFAHPDLSSGTDQANYFLAHGGHWSPDGITLPGVLDIEPNPDTHANQCYGLSTSAMVSWVKDFSDTYLAQTGRYPVIYTTTYWWNTCTGNSGDFAANNPLWISDWSSKLGALPAGWKDAAFWQYANSGPNPGDADRWMGDSDGLKSMALGS